MNLEPYGEVWVCTDCYFAHHYGAHKVERILTEDETTKYLNGWESFPGAEETHIGVIVTDWYSGESDQPCDCEPLRNIHPDFLVFDATCSEHETEECDDDSGDWSECQHCGRPGWDGDAGTGEIEFSWSSCGGCGSHLGGSRYRLTMWKEVTNATA